jgi:CheY-like chemotaxis protein
MSEKNPTVLLVDDDPHTCSIFEMLMDHYQIPFWVAPNCASAVNLLKEHTVNTIIIDLFLPGADGFQTLTKISKMIDRANTRVLATTAYYTKDTGTEVINRGFDGYIPKPFVPDSFLGFLSDR